MDYYGEQRALCGGSLAPWKIWGGHLPTPDPPPQMAPLFLAANLKVFLVAAYPHWLLFLQCHLLNHF